MEGVFEVRAFARGNAGFCERKVRTPQGRIPRENGGGASQGALTDSVTENTPPTRERAGKGEKAR